MYMPNVKFTDDYFTIESETATYYRCKLKTDIVRHNIISAILTSSAGQLIFSLPLYKRFPNGTTVVSMKGHISNLYGSSHSGEHHELITDILGVDFDTSQSVVVRFTNAALAEKTVTQKPTLTLQGGACLHFDSGNLGAKFFTYAVQEWGEFDYTNEFNNNPCVLELSSVEIVLQIPKVV